MTAFEDEKLSIKLINGVVYVAIKEIIIDLEAAQHIEKSRITFQDFKAFAVITNISEVKEITNEARNFFNLVGCKYMLTNAMISNSYYNTLLANAYIMIQQQKTPIKLFTSLESAEKWTQKILFKNKVVSWTSRIMFWK